MEALCTNCGVNSVYVEDLQKDTKLLCLPCILKLQTKKKPKEEVNKLWICQDCGAFSREIPTIYEYVTYCDKCYDKMRKYRNQVSQAALIRVCLSKKKRADRLERKRKQMLNRAPKRNMHPLLRKKIEKEKREIAAEKERVRLEKERIERERKIEEAYKAAPKRSKHPMFRRKLRYSV